MTSLQNCTVNIPDSRLDKATLEIPLPGGKAVFELNLSPETITAIRHTGKLAQKIAEEANIATEPFFVRI